ncbi:CPBP family intramembrane glutamic endopeptidase [Alkaliphilus hydrothermalis]|uniref:CAAX prenyl protease 2/Lysostaphin resistance protein A-like domain-containing protein n=1 Tax=Alkaliphilus hydrothermalis TaxID=1482730 RepID=A0ABS2NQH2_9FIRM|nr:CPBP family intramembrane glutamic endopeptidase [Alkaliphilus hydrothermalis]MBM7615047.1 hypothetical protein [Alkaliphilus hydrothermalis]
MNHVKNINNYLNSLSAPMFIFLMTIITYIVYIPFIPLIKLFLDKVGPMGGPSAINSLPPAGIFIVVVIVAPLLETFLFQLMPIKILQWIPALKSRKYIVILVSAALFASTHSYSMLYIFYTFIIGILLAYSFCVYENKKSSAFMVVVLIHALRNAVSFLLSNVIA